MNLLNQYEIEFKIISFDNDKDVFATQTNNSNISFCLANFLTDHLDPDYLSDELIIEMDKAIQSDSFDEDGGGISTFLKIGFPNSIFTYTSDSEKNINISTIDLKDIIVLWIEFLNNNINE
ncbi:MAG: hypothetical protein AB8H03_16800 [Saprospiraceae bacterium]